MKRWWNYEVRSFKISSMSARMRAKANLKRWDLGIKEQRRESEKIQRHLTRLETRLLNKASKKSPAAFKTAQIRVNLALRRIMKRLVSESAWNIFAENGSSCQSWWPASEWILWLESWQENTWHCHALDQGCILILIFFFIPDQRSTQVLKEELIKQEAIKQQKLLIANLISEDAEIEVILDRLHIFRETSCRSLRKSWKSSLISDPSCMWWINGDWENVDLVLLYQIPCLLPLYLFKMALQSQLPKVEYLQNSTVSPFCLSG